MGMHETVTLVTDRSAEAVAAQWPADEWTWIQNVQRSEGAVSCLLTANVGPDAEALATALLEGMPAVDRVAWTQLHNTSDSCVVAVFERAPSYEREPVKRVLRVAGGVDYWRLARDAVREQADVPVMTWYEIIEEPSDVQTVPREETPY